MDPFPVGGRAPAAPALAESPTSAAPPTGRSTGVADGGTSRRSRRANNGNGAAPAEPTDSRGDSPPPGRNLPAAIGVGLVLGAVVVASLFLNSLGFVFLTAIVVIVAIWEIANAFRARRIRIPLIPTVVGAVGMLVSAYAAGADALFVAFALTSTAILWWRVIEGGDAIRDVTAGIFTAAYVPYLAGFAILMLREPDGQFRVMAFVIVTIASDVGGYVVGSRFGNHALAPSVSPHKTWEGLAGAMVLAAVTGALSVVLLLDASWWVGVVLGIAVTAAATIGDLSESLLKRDLNIKDMGRLLPGHGGIMDRVDSLLPAAPVAYVLLMVLAS